MNFTCVIFFLHVSLTWLFFVWNFWSFLLSMEMRVRLKLNVKVFAWTRILTDQFVACFRCICSQLMKTITKTRGSAIAEEPRDALRQLKYYGRFLTELLTRSSANPQEPWEHNVSWNHVKCCTNVRRIACEYVCNRWMTFKVIQGHCRCHHLIGHILFPISLPL